MTNTYQININGKRTVRIGAQSVKTAQDFFRRALYADVYVNKRSATPASLWVVWGKSGQDTLLLMGHLGKCGLKMIEDAIVSDDWVPPTEEENG